MNIAKNRFSSASSSGITTCTTRYGSPPKSKKKGHNPIFSLAYATSIEKASLLFQGWNGCADEVAYTSRRRPDIESYSSLVHVNRRAV